MATTADATTRESALLVPVPEAELLVGSWRAVHDPVASGGVPAHVTVLYPFVAPDEIDEELHRSLGDVFARCAPFSVRFTEVRQFPGALYLAPKPAEPFRRLTRAVVDRWPEHPPYRGAFRTVVPHLTLGDHLEESEQARLHTAAHADLDHQLPIRGRVEAVELHAQRPDGHWERRGRYVLLGPERPVTVGASPAGVSPGRRRGSR